MPLVNIIETKVIVIVTFKDVSGSFKSLGPDHTSSMGEEQKQRTNLQGLCLVVFLVIGTRDMNLISRPLEHRGPLTILPTSLKHTLAKCRRGHQSQLHNLRGPAQNESTGPLV